MPRPVEMTAAENAALDPLFELDAARADEIRAQRADYRNAAAAWDADLSAVEQWRQNDEAPVQGPANPGGDALPGADPTGRAFLDSIGATDVQVRFDAGDLNCGYAAQAELDTWRTLISGGCFQTAYPDWLFVAWEPGTEEFAWPLFVHEAMHWWQYQNYYPALLEADREGVPEELYDEEFETDASCRAVYLHGITRSAYADSSSPCTIDWYEGWFLDHLASLGVRVSAPTAEEFEVTTVIRP
ncbi:hypothetical protein [Microbacterium sediminicola]|uniref:hypothetical protein n=1 Tax=Microbacterium sediminicola TaxID=415210 RepID=UPI0031D6217B